MDEFNNKIILPMAETLNSIIKNSILDNWNRMALTDMGGMNYQYRDVAEQVAKIHIMFESAGVKAGDKVAICGKNSSNWAVTFIACLTSGVVAVPILHEFKPDTIHHLVNHSGAKLLFVDAAIWENLDEKLLPGIEAAIFISEFGMPFSRNEELTKVRNNLNEAFGKKFPYSFDKKDVACYDENLDDLAVINYTSGSTGMSKGVMLTYRNLWSNVRFIIDRLVYLKPGDSMVAMLPLAHMYGMVVEMLQCVCRGCHVYFLTRLPSPKVILNAFAEVKPKVIITVPLILEKIIRNKVFPLLDKPLMKILLRVPYLDDRLLAKIKENLIQAFGGQLEELIVGGAPLNAEVEKFLYKIGFPVTVGYGMTECAPLISYAPWHRAKPHTVGVCVERMEVKIDSPDPENVPGNIVVKGDNVMKGYYRNEKATREVMPDDSGWMNTGDMGTLDADGYISISGRSKTMILGPSGQNIYPEEIEDRLNSMPLVVESVVVQRDTKLVGLVYPDYDEAKSQGLADKDIDAQMQQNLQDINLTQPAYCKLSAIEIQKEEFEKTPKKSIKRYLYK